MRSATVLLCSTVAAGVYASTTISSQCILDVGPSSLRATCSPRSPNFVFSDRYEQREYAEIALHYPDGTEDVISATGRDPRCIPEAPDRHPVSFLRAQDARPYKATWTRIHYIASSLGESLCAEDIISETVNAISVHSIPTGTSASIGASTTSHEVTEMDPSGHLLEARITTGDVGYTPIKRRATLGELCQLLLLFVVLGALHYASMQFAARWQAPPPMERVCE
ncbi:unnamed protein product [Rhizoctonia solani]|uniref:Autophagy-related protein 27 n=1 Tax=Rhizoctonia solani TaxID=456999 RepID=A0A8H3E0W5_9AGAM|nr:unnamed protein product [Rhizoctonia solani]